SRQELPAGRDHQAARGSIHADRRSDLRHVFPRMDGRKMESAKRRPVYKLSPIACRRALLIAAVLLAAGAFRGFANAQEVDDGHYTSHPLLPKTEVNVASGPQGVTIYIGVT